MHWYFLPKYSYVTEPNFMYTYTNIYLKAFHNYVRMLQLNIFIIPLKYCISDDI